MPQNHLYQITDEYLNSALEKHKAVVVHFSHHSNMRAGGVFPDDLQVAISNKDKWALSCSVLWPEHNMEPCGSVGVMFIPTVASVLSVSNTDAGSFSGSDGADYSAGWPLNADSLEETFLVSGTYNEWRVRGAEVIGIFVLDIERIEAKRAVLIQGLPDGEALQDIGVTEVELTDVHDAFPTLPIFTMTSSGLVCVVRP